MTFSTCYAVCLHTSQMTNWTRLLETQLQRLHHDSRAIFVVDVSDTIRLVVWRHDDTLNYYATRNDKQVMKGVYECPDWGEDRTVYQQEVKHVVFRILDILLFYTP